MRQTAIVMTLLLLAAAQLDAGEDCAAARAARERLFDGGFEVVRTFTISINGKPKRREVARLSFEAGELEVTLLEEEVLSRGLVLESDGGDFFVDAKLACERLRRTGTSVYELDSEDGLEVVTFELDTESGTLRPLSWRLDTTERFLFKKLMIEGRATYSNLRRR